MDTPKSPLPPCGVAAEVPAVLSEGTPAVALLPKEGVAPGQTGAPGARHCRKGHDATPTGWTLTGVPSNEEEEQGWGEGISPEDPGIRRGLDGSDVDDDTTGTDIERALLDLRKLFNDFFRRQQQKRDEERRNSTQAQIERMRKVYSFIYRQYGRTFLLSCHDELLWWYMGMRGHLEKYLKWQTGRLLALQWRQEELPKSPVFMEALPPHLKDLVPPYGLTTGCDAFWRTRARSSRPQRLAREFAYSLLQAKAGALPVGPEFVNDQVEEAIVRLTTSPETPEEITLPSGVLLSRDEVEDAIRRTVREIYGPAREHQRDTPCAEKIPSIKSSFESPRNTGGAFGHLTLSVMGQREESDSSFLGFDHLIYMVERAGRVAEIRSHFDPSEWKAQAEDIKRRSYNRRVPCLPVGLVEPFKVRVITRGAADIYYTASRWQKALWAPLSRHPVTQLVGGPVTDDIMSEFLQKCDPLDSREFLSGDYTAATDYFDPELSNLCLEAACDSIGVPFEDKGILLKALTGHDLFQVEEPGSPPIYRGEQRRGQLMGSPISFPVLCLMNVAASRLSLEKTSGRRLSLNTLPMLVNGDDLLMRATPEEYEDWKATTSYMGLIPSIGKNFRSPDIATINSEMWQIWRETPSKDVRSTASRLGLRIAGPFRGRKSQIIQMGMLWGSVKGGASGAAQAWGDKAKISGLAELQSESLMLRDFLSSCPNAGRAYQFMAEERLGPLLAKVPPGVPLCLPPWLGGLGFPLPPEGSPYRRARAPTGKQLLIASYLKAHYFTENGWEAERLLQRSLGVESPYYLDCFMRQWGQAHSTLRVPKRRPIPEDDVDFVAPEARLPPLSAWVFYGRWSPDVLYPTVEETERREAGTRRGNQLLFRRLALAHRRGMERAREKLFSRAKAWGRAPLRLKDLDELSCPPPSFSVSLLS
ncbi:RNA-dependent RNA polymerase [Beihai narna-like virus 3]|uniref:RNA-dependent RNA polymerase n=1 Tax=Beihai narna-like virus 3 TaxID=1922455 RepID=UPI00090AA4F7|nr:RNA-dependent RNA polymerase [Beihai narna-like virus 3]APG76986.1 RNA-dependent RNA polymerase [Beihai narna-like virus 3]